MSVHIRKKRGRLYLDVYYKGRRTWESTGLSLSTDKDMSKESLRLAEILRAKREHQLVSAVNGLPDRAGGRQSLADYLQKIADKGKPGHEKHVLPYLKKYDPHIVLEAIDERWLEGFREYLRESSLGPSSSSAYFRTVLGALRRAVTVDHALVRSPTVKGIAQPESKRQYLTTEELQRLSDKQLESPRGRLVCRSFLFMCNTALRISDTVSLTWGDVQRPPDAKILIRQRKTGGVTGVPLNGDAWKIINDDPLRLPRPQDKVFPGLTVDGNFRYYQEWKRRAEITKALSPHIARHTAATRMLESGASLETVSRILGHRDLQTTAIYAKTTDKSKRMAVDNLPEIKTGKKGV